MRPLLTLALAALLAMVVLIPPARAGIRPYVRAAYAGSQFRMSALNDNIVADQEAIRSVGLPAEFQKMGNAFGPDLSAGLWLFGGFRIGATYTHLRSIRENRSHVPGYFYYGDRIELRTTEIGGEAALRIQRLAGLTFGGQIAQGHAELVEGYAIEDLGGAFYSDATGERRRPTYGVFIGIDQTNAAGIAGFVRAGYRFRDMGSFPVTATVSDGTLTLPATGSTVDMDYSGYYVTVGVGFDLLR